MLHQSNQFVVHHKEVLENEPRRTRREGWCSSSSTRSMKGVKAPVIAVPISTFNQTTTQISMVPPPSAFLLSTTKIHSLSPKSTPSLSSSDNTTMTTSTSTLEDDNDWVGIEKDYWVIDGELIEDDPDKEARNKLSAICQKFQDWMKMKRGRCLSKKQQQHHSLKGDINYHVHNTNNVMRKKRNRKIANITDDPTLSSDMPLMVPTSNVTNSYYYQRQQQQLEQQSSIRMVQPPSFSNCSPKNDSTSRTIFSEISKSKNSKEIFSSSPSLIEDQTISSNSLYDEEKRVCKSQDTDEMTLDHQHFLTQKLLKIKEYILSSNILLQIKLQKKLNPHFYSKNDLTNHNNNNPYAFHSNYYCPIISKQDIYIFLSTCRQEDNVIVQELLSSGCAKLSSLYDLVEHLCQVLVKNRVLYRITNQVFYIPSLLHHQDYDVLMDNDLRCHASSVWSYKCIESWKVTLCHSWTFQTDVIGNIVMQDIDVMSIVISGIFAKFNSYSNNLKQHDEAKPIHIRHASCWKNACYLILTSPITAAPSQALSSSDSSKTVNLKENIVELFFHWVDTTNNHTISESTDIQYKELRVSAKGQCGTHGKRIYQGGYALILSAIDDIFHQDKLLQTLIFKKEIICPDCLAMNSISRSCLFDYNHVIQAEHCGLQNDCNTCIVCDYGHSIDTRTLTGTQRKRNKNTMRNINPHTLNHNHDYEYAMSAPTKKHIHTLQENPLALTTRWNNGSPRTDSPTASLLTTSFDTISRAVVLVGLWSPKEKRIISVGSGFIIDKKLGLVVTAAHTLIHMGASTNSGSNNIGVDYYGCKHGKAIIGIIPPQSQQQNGSSKNKHTFHTAIFRYSAEIIAKDIQNVDACILRITTKFEHDVPIQNQGEDIANISAEIPLTNHDSLVRKELLQSLDVTYDFEIQEQIRIIGYNQGGEGLINHGMWITGALDFAFGYVCKHFCTNDKLHVDKRILRRDVHNIKNDKGNKDDRLINKNIIRNPFSSTSVSGNNKNNNNSSSTVFYPRQELVIICPTLTGHSGGPCCNQQGEVIGILSRVDSVDSDRCYVVPACEWKLLLKKAKKICKSTSHPLDNFLKL